MWHPGTGWQPACLPGEWWILNTQHWKDSTYWALSSLLQISSKRGRGSCKDGGEMKERGNRGMKQAGVTRLKAEVKTASGGAHLRCLRREIDQIQTVYFLIKLPLQFKKSKILFSNCFFFLHSCESKEGSLNCLQSGNHKKTLKLLTAVRDTGHGYSTMF